MAQSRNIPGRPATANGSATARTEGLATTFFSHAFRPFFLAAGVYAALALAAWLAWIGIHAMGGAPVFMSVAEPLHLWHAHEMVYGFGAAAVGGFLLTAVPNWTGAQHSRGAVLALMFVLWLAGRVAMWVTALLPPAVPLFLDLAFLPVLGIAAGRQLAVKPALRNAIFLSLVLALVLGNFLYHLGRLEIVDDGMRSGVVLGLGTLVVMIVVIGGRVIPAFTTNALRRQGVAEDRLPMRRAPVDMACLFLSAAAVVLQVLAVSDALTGWTALAAAIANGVRLAGWRGLATLREPIVWVLHLGYAWIVAGFALLAAAMLTGWIGEVAALHAFGTGAAGTMILSIMSRAALGHTGRAIVAPLPVAAAYVLVSIAALLRTFGPALMGAYYNEVMLTAGAAWIAAFSLYTIVFAPILLGPRVPRGGTG
jgi:uncharacterized protein involved in response to NO